MFANYYDYLFPELDPLSVFKFYHDDDTCCFIGDGNDAEPGNNVIYYEYTWN